MPQDCYCKKKNVNQPYSRKRKLPTGFAFGKFGFGVNKTLSTCECVLGSCGHVCRAAAAWSLLCFSYILNTVSFFVFGNILSASHPFWSCVLCLCQSLKILTPWDTSFWVPEASSRVWFYLKSVDLVFSLWLQTLWFQVWLLASWSSCYSETRLHSLLLLVAYLCEFFSISYW